MFTRVKIRISQLNRICKVVKPQLSPTVYNNH